MDGGVKTVASPLRLLLAWSAAAISAGAVMTVGAFVGHREPFTVRAVASSFAIFTIFASIAAVVPGLLLYILFKKAVIDSRRAVVVVGAGAGVLAIVAVNPDFDWAFADAWLFATAAVAGAAASGIFAAAVAWREVETDDQ